MNDGAKYEGEFKRGVKDGRGKYIDGSVYDG